MDCPRRCAVPNCHNPETCETWAQYLAETGAIKEARAKQRAAEKDVTAVAVANSRRAAKEAKRHKCRN